jgi:hypothetical protein
MIDLVHVLGLRPLLQKWGVTGAIGDFEDLYSRLAGQPAHSHLCLELEAAVESYFSSLELPDEPTLYDHLILSLRQKDCIATFNWDPLLFQASQRNYQKAPTPHLLFLHGNTAVGYCHRDKVKGPRTSVCLRCDAPFLPSRLLYPVTDKNYSADPSIHAEWTGMGSVMRGAYLVTIFGYSAPRTNQEAIRLLKEGWGPAGKRNLEELEFIDIKPEDEITDTWKDFIHSHHYGVVSDFYSSYLHYYPRRSCEAFWSASMEMIPFPEFPLPRNETMEDLWHFVEPFVKAERGG